MFISKIYIKYKKGIDRNEFWWYSILGESWAKWRFLSKLAEKVIIKEGEIC